MKPDKCPKCGSKDIGELDIPGYDIEDLPSGYTEEEYEKAGGRWYCITCGWMSKRFEEGWGWPTASRKAHYFVNATSLCGRWGIFRGELYQGNDDSPDNCAECKRLLEERRKKRDETNTFTRP